MKSSHYGLNMLGYTRVTKINTERYYREIFNKPLKIILVRIEVCKSTS